MVSPLEVKFSDGVVLSIKVKFKVKFSNRVVLSMKVKCTLCLGILVGLHCLLVLRGHS